MQINKSVKRLTVIFIQHIPGKAKGVYCITSEGPVNPVHTFLRVKLCGKTSKADVEEKKTKAD